MTDTPPTPLATLQRAQQIGLEEGLHYVYVGNIPGEGNDTFCPSCGRALIRRHGFGVIFNRLETSHCPACGEPMAFDHVLREYMVRLKVIKDGEVEEVNAASDLEAFRFTEFGKDEVLECAITPGMPSFIFTRSNLKEFAEKTIRWPGHWQSIEVLKECGLLDLQPVEVRGVKIAPRDFLLTVIEPKLQPLAGDTDICLMWNTVTGIKDGRQTKIDYYLWEEADVQNNISAMARVTGFSAAIGALFLGRGMIISKGIVPPEDGIKGGLYKTQRVRLRSPSSGGIPDTLQTYPDPW
jgi:hypothetical protein